MQNVACPTMIVLSASWAPANVKSEFSAIPVMIPGSASGRTRRNDTVSRPKKRKRATAPAAADPSTTAIAVATKAAFSDRESAVRIALSCQAAENHLTESPEIGQLWTFEGLKA